MIEVGEYVKTHKGDIHKVIGIREEVKEGKRIYSHKAYYLDSKKGSLTEAFIIKHSKNIIDLIEEEDIVILEYKTPKYRERIERKFIVCKIDDFINFENRNCNFTYKVGDKKIVDKICKNIKIKGILTTEQFNNEYYRLEE